MLEITTSRVTDAPNPHPLTHLLVCSSFAGPFFWEAHYVTGSMWPLVVYSATWYGSVAGLHIFNRGKFGT
jgi:hypothetical protein